MKIRRKLITYFLIVLLVPVSVLSFVLLRNSQINLENQIIDRMETLADYRKSQIDQFLTRQTEIVSAIAGTTAITERLTRYQANPTPALQEALSEEINDYLHPLKDIQSISLINTGGVTIASTDPGKWRERLGTERFPSEGKTIVAFFRQDGTTLLSFVAPIVSNGKVIGFVRSVMPLDPLERIVSDRTGLENTGEILFAVPGSNGRPWFITKRQFENQANDAPENAVPMIDALNGQEQTLFSVKDYRGEPVIAVTRSLASVDGGLVIKVDERAIDAPLTQLLTTTTVVSLFAILLTVLIAWFLSETFADPINALIDITKKISKERLQIAFPKELLTSQDEIGSLSLHFKSMMDHLAGAYRRVETANKEREQFLKFFQLSTDIMVIADPLGRFLKVNPTCLKLLGYKESELLAKPFVDFIHPDDQQRTRDEMAHQMQTGSSLNFENRYLRKDGTVLWLSWRANYHKTEGITYATARDITEQKKANDALREQEKQLENAQRVANLGSWYWDVAENNITWSDQYHRMVGLPIVQPPPNYEDHLAYYTAESAERLDKAVQLATKKGTPFELELNLTHPLGTNKWLLARGEAVRDAKGNVTALQGTILDITERKRLQEKIRLRERALTVLSGGNRALMRTESEETLLKEMCRIIVTEGKYRLAWIGYRMVDTRKTVAVAASAGHDKNFLKKIDVVWSDTARGQEPTGTCIREQKAVVAQNLATLKSYGPWRADALKQGYASVIALPLFVDAEIIGALTIFASEPDAFLTEERELLEGFAADISYGIATLRLRLQQQQSAEQLMQDAEEINDLYEHAPCGYHSLDAKGTYLRINDTELAMLGYTRGEIIGKKKSTDIIAPESLQSYKKVFADFFKRGFITDAEFDLVRKDGTRFPASISATGMTDASGKIIASRSMVIDITERKRIEQKSKEVDQMKNKFIQIVSHQLRTPLNVIRWNLETLLEHERGQITSAQEETLRSTYAADIEIISRVNELLIALDIEEKRLRIERDFVDPNDLLPSIIKEKIQPCERKQLTCLIKPSKKRLPKLSIDGDKIRDVIVCLIDNAIAYTKEKGKITIAYGIEDKNLRFEITDTGIGIPTSEQPHIFERFHRGWNATQMKPNASGLGLFISKHTIEAHGGSMGFTSKEKKGSTFWFTLPISTKA